MSMETTCPQCRTTFRVTTEQLNAHQGDVRCGICAHLFNAFDSLAPAREAAGSPEISRQPEQPVVIEPVAEAIAGAEEHVAEEIPLNLEAALAPSVMPAPAEPLSPVEAAMDFGAAIESVPAAEAEPASGVVEEISLDLDEVLEVAAAPEPAPQMPGAEAAPLLPEAAPGSKPKRVPAEIQAIEDIYADFAKAGVLPPAAEEQAVAATQPVAASAKAAGYPPMQLESGAVAEDAEAELILPRPAIETWEGAVPSRRRHGWLWGLGAVPLLLLLAGQAGYFYRVELASRMPAMRPYLEQACGLMGCTVPLPRNADLLKIESSDLEADTENPAKVTLSTVISNRASYLQAYPLLELTLTDHADQPVARRVFAPKEYLPAGSAIKTGMAANAESTIRLSLDLGDLNAVGYRLYVFYPAQR